MKLIPVLLWLLYWIPIADAGEVLQVKGRHFTFVVGEEQYKTGDFVQVLGHAWAWHATGEITTIKEGVALVKLTDGVAQKGMEVARMRRSLANTSAQKIQVSPSEPVSQHKGHFRLGFSQSQFINRDQSSFKWQSDAYQMGYSLDVLVGGDWWSQTSLMIDYAQLYDARGGSSQVLNELQNGLGMDFDSYSLLIGESIGHNFYLRKKTILRPFLGFRLGVGLTRAKGDFLSSDISYQGESYRYGALIGVQLALNDFILFLEYEQGQRHFFKEEVEIKTPRASQRISDQIFEDSTFDSLSLGVGYHF